LQFRASDRTKIDSGYGWQFYNQTLSKKNVRLPDIATDISQLTIPVALINERLSEALDPGNFHFMRYVKCLDTGVDCLGFGEVMMKVRVIPRVKKEEGLSS
jgi:hypothetical protein